MVLWELTLATAYFLGLKRTYRLALKIQKRVLLARPGIRDFAKRRTRAVFRVALTAVETIQHRDIEIGRSVGNFLLRFLDRMKPSAHIRGDGPHMPGGAGGGGVHSSHAPPTPGGAAGGAPSNHAPITGGTAGGSGAALTTIPGHTLQSRALQIHGAPSLVLPAALQARDSLPAMPHYLQSPLFQKALFPSQLIPAPSTYVSCHHAAGATPTTFSCLPRIVQPLLAFPPR
ncbi:unnamed protein product [Closterium sp. Naga37s-1]|nr:unnamed protein product [Closterium sp. Naga37s-1]